jgi:hypothetical protein
MQRTHQRHQRHLQRQQQAHQACKLSWTTAPSRYVQFMLDNLMNFMPTQLGVAVHLQCSTVICLAASATAGKSYDTFHSMACDTDSGCPALP